MSDQFLFIDHYVFEYIFSLLGNQQNVCRAGATCKLWRIFAHSQHVWRNIPIVISKIGMLETFINSVRNGLIPYVLNSRSLTLKLNYPRVSDQSHFCNAIDHMLDEHLYQWYNNLSDITMKIQAKYSKGSKSAPCGMSIIRHVDKVLSEMLLNCTKLTYVNIHVISSSQMAIAIHKLCEKHNIKLENLSIFHMDFTHTVNETQSFRQNMSYIIEKCAPSLLSISLDDQIELLPVIAKYCSTTLKKLCFSSMRSDNPASTSALSSLDELTIHDVFYPHIPYPIDLTSVGKSVRTLNITAYNVERDEYVNINNLLGSFTNVKNLKLCIHGDINPHRYTETTPIIDLSALEKMQQLNSAVIEITGGANIVKIDYEGIFGHLANTPVSKLTIRECDQLDQIASIIGTRFVGRLSMLHFIGNSTMSAMAAKIACMAINKSILNGSFYATIDEYNPDVSQEIINSAIGPERTDKRPLVKMSAKAVNISVSW